MLPIKALQMRNPSVTGPADPYWSNVQLLLGYNGGTLGNQAFTDESSAARTMLVSGAARKWSTDKFSDPSGFCLDLDNVGGYVYTADSPTWAMGTTPFTLETWAWFGTAPTSGFHYLIAQYDTNAQRAWALLVQAGSLQMLLSSAGTSGTAVASAAHTFATSTWHHIAGDWDGTAYRTYANGSMVGKSTTPVTIFNSTAPLTIGAALSSGVKNSNFVGFLDETRVTVGVARYATDAGFAVPTTAYPRH